MDENGNPGQNVVFLLGAGASCGAGYPTSRGLIDSLKRWIEARHHADAADASRVVLELVLGDDPGANIEDVVDAAAELGRRSHSALARLSHGLKPPLDKIESCNPEVLDHLAGVMIETVFETLSPSVDPVPHLRTVARLAQRSSAPYVFTLNYDTSMEIALAAESLPYANGFRRPVPGTAEGLMLPDLELWPVGYQRACVQGDLFGNTPTHDRSRVKLVKLHGSVDWYRVASSPCWEGGLRISPQDRIVRLDEPPDYIERVMIVGRTVKERLEEPYNILLRELYTAIRRADVVVVVGYSFSDPHINRVLVNAQVFERCRSFDLVVINGPEWPRDGNDPGDLSREARRTWTVLAGAGRQAGNENLFGLRVVPSTAEEAFDTSDGESAVTVAIEECIDVRLHGL